MHGAVLSIGDELLNGEALDTNTQWISARLAERGVTPIEHRTVGDDRPRIAAALAELASVAEILVITGGLGPTDDDVTRFALGDVLDPGIDLVSDPTAVAHLTERYARRGRPMPASNTRQTLRPPSARMLPNPHGTALGLAGDSAQCRIFVLPGPPREMEPMLLDHVLSSLPAAGPAGATLSLRRVHSFGLSESQAAEELGELTRRDRVPQVGITVSGGVVTARIRAVGTSAETEALIEPVRRRVVEAWTPYAFGEGGQTLPEVVGGLLRARGETLATAESCTGGWVGKLLVDTAGSSEYYRGGWVTYTNALKCSELGVDPGLLETHGAVSAPASRAMARGAVRAARADHAVAITGIAGPDGGTPDKPVGTVYVALAHADAPDERVGHFRLAGDRETIRHRSALSALQMLRFALLDLDEWPRLLWEEARVRPGGPCRALERRPWSVARRRSPGAVADRSRSAGREPAPPGRTLPSPVHHPAAIGLGSNLGDRDAHLRHALAALEQTEGIVVDAVSRLIETEPLGPPGQPRYLNAAALIRTRCTPRELLSRCQAIERERGRERTREQRWGPRTLDLDLLLYGQSVVEEPGLRVPHPRMEHRRFVLEPLAEIAPEWVHPVRGRTIECLLESLGMLSKAE